MRLGALIDDLDAAVGDIDVAGIATDSREVCPGEVFFALPGLRTDGRRHLAEAVVRGARAIVAEGPAVDAKVPVVLVRGVRRVLAIRAPASFSSASPAPTARRAPRSSSSRSGARPASRPA